VELGFAWLHAGAPWNESGSGRGAGATLCTGSGGSEQDGRGLAGGIDSPFSPACIRPVEEKIDAPAAPGQRVSAASQTGGNRRAFRTLSSARVGSRTRHGKVVGTLRVSDHQKT
jgi:hypothetical protein